MINNAVGDVIIHFISLRSLMGIAMTWWFGYSLHSVTLLQHVKLPSLFNVKTNLATLASLLEEYILCNQNSCTDTVGFFQEASQRCPCDFIFFHFVIFYLFCITQTLFFPTDLFALSLLNSNTACIDALEGKRHRISHFKIAVMEYFYASCGVVWFDNLIRSKFIFKESLPVSSWSHMRFFQRCNALIITNWAAALRILVVEWRKQVYKTSTSVQCLQLNK